MITLMAGIGSTPEALLPGQTMQLQKQIVGIRIADASNRRLLEGIVANLDLESVSLSEDDLSEEQLFSFEMILADEQTARHLRSLIKQRQSAGQHIKPALIAVVAAPYKATSEEADRKAFDGILALPEKPAVISAQLGVSLYAYRSFAYRYQSDLDELNLNRRIFRSITSGISIADARMKDHPLLYVNPAFEVMTGYSLEEIEGKNCRFLQGNHHDQPGLTLIREAIAQKRETVAVLRNYRKDGTGFWNELSISPIHNADGVLTHFVGIQNDVTERVEFEIALRESEKLAAVGRLTSSIAHEVNNPLEALMNLLYLAREAMPRTGATEVAERYLAMMDDEMNRAKLITARSLRFYKQSGGPEAVLAEDLVRSTLDVYSSRFRNYDITVERRERSTQHMVCLASEIRQVLSNLITNAVDAMRAKGGRLRVRTKEATDWRSGTKGVVITVADMGKGMSPDTRANIYHAFFTTKGDNGTGLGLWISAEIVQRHNGRLTVRSREGHRSGTVFALFLPYQGVSGSSNPDGEAVQSSSLKALAAMMQLE